MNTDDHGKPMPDSTFAMAPGTTCPKCGGTEFELRNYSMAMHDGDIHCVKCGEYIRRVLIPCAYIRMFDAG